MFNVIKKIKERKKYRSGDVWLGELTLAGGGLTCCWSWFMGALSSHKGVIRVMGYMLRWHRDQTAWYIICQRTDGPTTYFSAHKRWEGVASSRLAFRSALMCYRCLVIMRFKSVIRTLQTHFPNETRNFTPNGNKSCKCERYKAGCYVGVRWSQSRKWSIRFVKSVVIRPSNIRRTIYS